MVTQDTLQQQVHDAQHKVWECTLAAEEATANYTQLDTGREEHSALDDLQQKAAGDESAAQVELDTKKADLDSTLELVEQSRQAIWNASEKTAVY
jgi:hypothetical protein